MSKTDALIVLDPIGAELSQIRSMPEPLGIRYANLLPPLTTEEFSALKASIEADGVRDPIWVDETGNVLDGHHRLKIDPNAPRRVIGGLSEAKKQAFALQANFVRRNLSPTQKRDVRARMKKVAAALRHEDPMRNTQERVASLLGVDRTTVGRWLNMQNVQTHITHKAPDARVKIPSAAHTVIAERIANGESQAQVAADYGVAQPQISRIVKTQKTRRAAQAAGAETGGNVLTGDISILSAELADGTVDMFLTDPVYFEPQGYAKLAELAAAKLKPGGLCLAYSGHIRLPDVINAMTEHLRWWWIFAIEHAGTDTLIHSRRVHNAWKPVIALFKPPLTACDECLKDHLHGGGREKTHHDWQQAESEASYLIRKLTRPGDLVVDPFCGSGTTLLAAKRLGRRWLGCDREAAAASTARYRLDNTNPPTGSN